MCVCVLYNAYCTLCVINVCGGGRGRELGFYLKKYWFLIWKNKMAILPHNGFNNLFPTVQEINHFMEVGWLKKLKCIVMYQYPTCDMHLVHRKR